MSSGDVEYCIDVSEWLKRSPTTLLFFTATWCEPCKKLKPSFAEYATKCGKANQVAFVDVDECPDAVRAHRIQALPTLLIFVDGKETGRHIGSTICMEDCFSAILGSEEEMLPFSSEAHVRRA